MKKISYLIILLLFGSGIIAQNTQQVIATAGETYTSDDISISWTLGETVIETFEAGDIILTQGFHQDTYVIDAIPEFQDMSIDISVFPNPAREEFFIQYGGDDFKNFEIGIYNLNGNLLMKKNITDKLTGIDISELESAEYIISVLDKTKIYRSYKLVKF
jgi:type IX secretion system substrate protein